MSNNISRKDFLIKTGSALAVTTFGFPSIILPKQKEKLGIALVGLGNYSTNLLAPGLQRTEHIELRGIVTGTPAKIPVWQEKHGIPDGNIYNYEAMHEIANNDDIDVIYIVLPNSMHAEYAIKAADAGKHVFCEKPMAMDEAECQSIIDAANKNGVQLTVGYRMQHEPNTQTIIRYGKEETYGKVTAVDSKASFRANFSKGYWRTVAAMGGGSLYDMGVYNINASRYATGMEPIAVKGNQWSERDTYSEVDEYTEFELEFANGIRAKGYCSFGDSVNYLQINCENGWYRLSPFQAYNRVGGETSDGTQLRPDPHHQQARQMDDDAIAIKENKPLIVRGEEGLADVRIVRAIMESSKKDGEWIKLT